MKPNKTRLIFLIVSLLLIAISNCLLTPTQNNSEPVQKNIDFTSSDWKLVELLVSTDSGKTYNNQTCPEELFCYRYSYYYNYEEKNGFTYEYVFSYEKTASDSLIFDSMPHRHYTIIEDSLIENFKLDNKYYQRRSILYEGDLPPTEWPDSVISQKLPKMPTFIKNSMSLRLIENDPNKYEFGWGLECSGKMDLKLAIYDGNYEGGWHEIFSTDTLINADSGMSTFEAYIDTALGNSNLLKVTAASYKYDKKYQSFSRIFDFSTPTFLYSERVYALNPFFNPKNNIWPIAKFDVSRDSKIEFYLVAEGVEYYMEDSVDVFYRMTDDPDNNYNYAYFTSTDLLADSSLPSLKNFYLKAVLQGANCGTIRIIDSVNCTGYILDSEKPEIFELDLENGSNKDLGKVFYIGKNTIRIKTTQLNDNSLATLTYNIAVISPDSMIISLAENITVSSKGNDYIGGYYKLDLAEEGKYTINIKVNDCARNTITISDFFNVIDTVSN